MNLGFPEQLLGWGGTMFFTSNDMPAVLSRVNQDPQLAGFILANRVSFANSGIRPATDDWPYLYLRSNAIPSTFLLIIAGLLVLFGAGAAVIFRKGLPLDWRFIFLGAGFMLLEFQNISKSALLFGSTWLVNAYVIIAILTLTLLANAVVRFIKISSLRPYYFLLFASLALVYIFPAISNPAQRSVGALVIAAGLLNLPVFFAGIIFMRLFKSAARKDSALGSNVLGMAVGGLCEALSFVVGIKALLIPVFVF